MIIKSNHPVQASKQIKAGNPQQRKHQSLKAWLKESKFTRSKHPPKREGERNG